MRSGAFTGAVKRTVEGKIEAGATSGTLFLDEIGDVPHQQSKSSCCASCRNSVIERVGGRKAIPVDVRVVCATQPRRRRDGMAAGALP